MTALSELLNAHLPDGWNGARLAHEAEARGHVMHRATAADYLRGRHAAEPDEAKLAAFADVLNIPIEDLRRAAGVPVGDREPWSPPAEANRLSPRARRALDELIRAMVEAPDATGSDHRNRAERSPLRAAAYEGDGENGEDPTQ